MVNASNQPQPPKQRLSQNVLAAVGDAICSWSTLEAALTQHLIHFVPYDETGECTYLNLFLLTAGLSVEATVGLLQTLVGINFSKQAADDFDKLASCIRNAYTKRRNVVAHKMWPPGSKPDRIKVWDIKTVGSFKMESREITATELHKWAEDFRSLSAKLDTFMKAQGRPLPPEPVR